MLARTRNSRSMRSRAGGDPPGSAGDERQDASLGMLRHFQRGLAAPRDHARSREVKRCRRPPDAAEFRRDRRAGNAMTGVECAPDHELAHPPRTLRGVGFTVVCRPHVPERDHDEARLADGDGKHREGSNGERVLLPARRSPREQRERVEPRCRTRPTPVEGGVRCVTPSRRPALGRSTPKPRVGHVCATSRGAARGAPRARPCDSSLWPSVLPAPPASHHCRAKRKVQNAAAARRTRPRSSPPPTRPARPARRLAARQSSHATGSSAPSRTPQAQGAAGDEPEARRPEQRGTRRHRRRAAFGEVAVKTTQQFPERKSACPLEARADRQPRGIRRISSYDAVRRKREGETHEQRAQLRGTRFDHGGADRAVAQESKAGRIVVTASARPDRGQLLLGHRIGAIRAEPPRGQGLLKEAS